MLTRKIREREREKEKERDGGRGSRETRELGTDRQPHTTTQQKKKIICRFAGIQQRRKHFYS